MSMTFFRVTVEYRERMLGLLHTVEIVTSIYQHIPVLYIIVYYCAYIIYCLSTIIK